MKHNNRKVLAGIVIFAMVSLACAISVPGSGKVDSIATSVAETVNAMAGTAVDELTSEPHEMDETPAPEASVEYPMRVSFTTPDGSLYTWLDGTAAPTLLVANEDVVDCVISPDGSLIAFTRASGYVFLALEVINADGTNRRTLLSASQAAAITGPEGAIGAEPGQLGWIPGTHTLSMSVRHYFEGPGLFVNQNFFVLDADTGVFSTLFDTGNTTWQFVWTPDGSKVAVSNPTGVDIYDASGVKIAGPVVTHPFINTASEYAWTANPLWAEDGSSLIVRVPPQDPFFATGSDANSTIWRVSTGDWSAEQILSSQMLYNMQGDTGVSPDLSKLIFLNQTGIPTDNTFNLIVRDLTGSSEDIYATGHFQGSLAWSPDSSHFFYSLGNMPSSQPYIGQVGSAPAAVVDFSNPMTVKWVDDNRYLVSTNDGGRKRLLMGTLGEPTGLIYDSLTTDSSGYIIYSVNR